MPKGLRADAAHGGVTCYSQIAVMVSVRARLVGWLQGAEKFLKRLVTTAADARAKRDRERDTPVITVHPRKQHVFNTFAPWKPGQEPYAKLPAPQCVLCEAVKTKKSAGEACPWFL